MKTLPPPPSTPHRASSRGFTFAGIAAALAAATLAACGPRDEAPLAGGAGATTTAAEPARVGAPVPAQAQPPVYAPAPAPAPAVAPGQTAVAEAAPSYATPPNGDAMAAPRYAPVPQASAGVPPPAYAPVPTQPVAARTARVAQATAPRADHVGSITSIEPIRTRPKGSGAGAVVGGVLGAVVGNQFGHGLGRAAMTGAGAAGGAIAGNNLERNYREGVSGYRVHVRLDNGSTRTFERSSIGNLHVGDRVRLDANGFHHG